MGSPLTVVSIDAWQVLDSRGTPTVSARVRLSDGTDGVAAVPSGASTGAHEAVELRDGGDAWAGRGVTRALMNVRGEIADGLRGWDASDLTGLDALLRDLDGTSELSRLGANATLSVSIAAAIAYANSQRVPLWNLYTDDPLIPMPMVNIVSGGAHAGRLIDIQDILVIPIGAESFTEAIHWALRVRAATAVLAEGLGLQSALVADEGGIAGMFATNRDAVSLVAEGIVASGLSLGTDVAIALDVAATQFQLADGLYRWNREDRTLSSQDLIAEVSSWCSEFPIVSVEDIVAEDDWPGWTAATSALEGIQLVGDDLFATNEARLKRGIEQLAANSVLVKVNQIGTLTSAHRVLQAAQAHGYTTVVSARSGETEDSWLADLAAGWCAGQIKVGSTTRSERLAKWNRVFAIEHDNPHARFAGWPPVAWASASTN